MPAEWTPMRWPDAWTDPSTLNLLKDSAIDYLLIDNSPALHAVRAAAIELGLHVADPGSPPKGIVTIKGEWPGVRVSRNGGSDASAGPTGAPWVDSNGWRVRLLSAMNPRRAIWIDAPPKDNALVTADSYVTAIADSAAYGGRWILSLDKQFAEDLVRKPESLKAWTRIIAAVDFFAAHKPWNQYVPEAVVGVVSDFNGADGSMSAELLNLLARSNQHSRIIPKETAVNASFDALRAVIYPDVDPPSPALRKQVIAFVEAGGLLITGPVWGELPPIDAAVNGHPRFSVRVLGKGRVASAYKAPDDPYLLANDSSILISHRYDLVRFWNCGTVASYYTVAPDRRHAVVHLLFYAGRGPDSASVRVAGPFRTATISTIDHPVPTTVKTQSPKNAIEVYLPPVSQYAALELGV